MTHYHKKILYLTIGFVVATLAPQDLYAQLNVQQQTSGNLEIMISPRYPGPETDFSARIRSFSVDLNQAIIYWYLGGKLVTQGENLVFTSLTAPQAGESATLRVVARGPWGQVEEQALIRPASVVMLTQAETYTPPFYKGKAVSTLESTVRIQAVPTFVGSNGNIIPTEKLIFKWFRNGTLVADASGLGKDLYSIQLPQLEEDIPTISVEVSYPTEQIFATTVITPQTSAPKLVLYEHAPLLGVVLNRALPSSVRMTGAELTLTGYPYFLPRRSTSDPNLTFTWRINQNPVSTPSVSPNELTVRKPDIAGYSDVSLLARDTSTLFEKASAAIRFDFNQ